MDREVVLDGRLHILIYLYGSNFILAEMCDRHRLTGYRLLEPYKHACDIPWTQIATLLLRAGGCLICVFAAIHMARLTYAYNSTGSI